MRQAVIDTWKIFSEPLEGRVHSMYLDVRELITTGVGNLIDATQSGSPTPWTPALSLPWHHELTGAPATQNEIRETWQALKARPDLAKRHWKYAAKLNDLRLSDEAIDALVHRKLLQNERELRKVFHEWDSWCADAQLGVCSMAWAMGPGFPAKFKNFTRYANAGDWDAARVSCKISTVIRLKLPDGSIREIPNPGTMPRNRANEMCFGNAALSKAHGLDPKRLWWPDVATAGEKYTPPAAADPRTEPQHVTDLAADTAHALYEQTEDERRKARDAAIRTVGDGMVDEPDDEGGNVA